MLRPSRSDDTLLAEVRRGDARAYVTLYERYVDGARRLARSMLRNPADVDDVVSEVFASVLAVIQRGKGPRDGFAAYLMASIRNECHRARRRGGRTTPVDTAEDETPPDNRALEVDPFARHDDADALQQALRALPPRAREVLWRTEVEGQSHQEIAEQIGSTPDAVAAHAMRARRALGDAYLQGHVATTPADGPLPTACRDTRGRLADLVRGSIATRPRRRLDAHISTCASCRDARDELERVNRHLRTAPGLPLAASIVHVGLKSRLAAWLTASSAPLVAATGLVVVSTVVPLAAAGRDHDRAQVELVAQPDADGSPAAAGTDPSTTRAPGPTGPEAGDRPSPTTPTTGPRQPRDDDRPGRRSDRPAPTTTPDGPTAPVAPAPATTSPPVAEDPPVTSTPPVSVPPLSLPPVEVPGVSTPEVSLPPVSLPLITVPSVTAPSITVPPVTVTVPPITVPPVTVTVPPITVPPIGG